MNLETYARLHALHGVHHAQIADPEFNAAVEAYVQAAVTAETEEAPESIESVSQRIDRVRAQVRHTMHDFYETCQRGFKLLALEISGDKLQIFDDMEALTDALEEGTAISELLELSQETLDSCYDNINILYEQEEFDKARDGLFFLVAIAPPTARYWTSLGFTYDKLNDFERAQKASLQALTLDPTSTHDYLICIRSYVQTRKINDAKRLCEQGITYAREHPGEQSDELETSLKEAKVYLETQVLDSN